MCWKAFSLDLITIMTHLIKLINGKPITTTGTNKEGKITASDLKPGKYRFVELGYASGKENSYIINERCCI